MDIENRPIDGAIITDESSSLSSKSYKNGSYNLAVREGKIYVIEHMTYVYFDKFILIFLIFIFILIYHMSGSSFRL